MTPKTPARNKKKDGTKNPGTLGEMPKRERGRPSLGDDARTKRLPIMVSANEADAIKDAAERSKVSVSAWGHEALVEKLARDEKRGKGSR